MSFQMATPHGAHQTSDHGRRLALDAAPSGSGQADQGGDTATISGSLLTKNDVAEVAPNRTSVASVKFLPLMVTTVPPPLGPWSGERFVMIGARFGHGDNCDTGGPQTGIQ